MAGGAWARPALAVAGTFGIAFALRGRAVPGVLTWLGTVSYSLYLLHLLVLGVLVRFTDHRPLIVIGFVAGSLLAAWASHRYVERPGQRLAVIFFATVGETARTRSVGKQRESV